MKREEWLTQPLRFLYWVFLKPTTLRNYQRQLGVDVDSDGDFSVLRVRKQLRQNPALRRHLRQMFLANFYGLTLGLLILMPLAEAMRVLLTPTATFSALNVALGVALGVAFGVAFGVAGGVAVGVALGVAFGVAFGVAVGVAGGVAGGVAVGVAVGVAFGVAFGVAGGVAVGVAFGVVGGVAFGVAGGVAVGVAFGVFGGVYAGFMSLGEGPVDPIRIGLIVGVVDIFIIWLLFFRIPLYLVYLPWNMLVYLFMRNSLGSTAAWYRRSPQHWDERIWFRLFFLDGLLVQLTKAERTAGLTAIDEVAASFRQGWAAPRAVERLLLKEFQQIDNLSALASIRQDVSWLPQTGPQAFWQALDQVAVDLNAAHQASSRFNQLTRLNRASAALREMQTALPQYQTAKTTKEKSGVDLTRLRDEMIASFNEEELRSLTFGLAVDFESLPGTGKTGKTIELIAEMQRQNRINELIELTTVMRPQSFSTFALQTAAEDIPFASSEVLRPILGQWIRLVETEVNRLTTEKEAGAEIPNPFIAGLPIFPDGKTVFKGRQDIFVEIEHSLSAAQIPTLLLFGPRRSGKTSLLLQLPQQLPSNVVPVFINLQEAAATVNSAAGFVVELAQKIAGQSLEHRGLTLPRVNAVDFEKEPYLTFGRWLNEAARPLVGYTLFITFDEFEWVEKAIEQKRLDESVLSFFRNLIQRGGEPPLALLFSGVHLLSELNYNWPSYFINVKTVKVGYLPEKDARNLITNPTEDFPLDYQPETLTAYLQQTHCQPYLVQLVGFELVNYLNSEDRRAQSNHLLVTLADLEVGFEKGLAAGQNYFAELWNSSSNQERLVLADLAAGAGLPAELDEGQLLLTTRQLVRRDLIEKLNGGYQIQVPLIARWIREEYPPRLVRAQIAGL